MICCLIFKLLATKNAAEKRHRGCPNKYDNPLKLNGTPETLV